MNNNYKASFSLGAFTTLTGGLMEQIDSLLSIILLVLGVISATISIVLSLATWYKNAKADGKITKEELDKLVNDKDIKENINNIKDAVDNLKKPKE